MADAEIETDDTFTGTVTARVAFFEPSAVVTVIVDVPPERAVKIPDDEIVAMLVFELDHTTALFVALDGTIVGLT